MILPIGIEYNPDTGIFIDKSGFFA